MDEPQDLESARAAAVKLCTGLRHIGLYADSDTDLTIKTVEDGRVAVLVDAIVGDLAFAKRVQDPEAADVDAEFRKLTRATEGDRFLDLRSDMEQRIREGKPLFGDLP